MTPQPRLTLRELVVTNGRLPTATIAFAPGLNLIVGASDTGKTFVFEAIDYMLGARGPLRRIPESKGYALVSLAVDPDSAPSVTLRRAFSGGEVVAIEFANGREAEPTAHRVLAAVQTKNSAASLSAYLLRAIGLEGREVRTNSSGDKQRLSFRNLSHLTMIGEERIIQQSSPVLKGQWVTKTADEGVFALLLTGVDDSSIVAVETKQERNARLAIQGELVNTLLEEKRSELKALRLGDVSLANEVERLDLAIDTATQTIVSSQTEIQGLEQQRDTLIGDRATHQSRLMFVDEQTGRLRLLQAYYATDYARLETLLQASRTFHTLPEGTCPFCHQPYPADIATASHDDIEAACTAEMLKIDGLRRDLALALRDFDEEAALLRGRLDGVARDLSLIETELQGVLLPSVVTEEAQLQILFKARTTVAQAVTIESTIRSFEDRLAAIARLSDEKPSKRAFERRTTTSAATEFCAIIEHILEAWKYPNLGRVTFDAQKVDLVIGGQDRANKGKGYRAITYAAFAIGLMKYCRLHGIPHPGFVVLDTPLNPFKGPASSAQDDTLADEVKLAFFRHLADDTIDDQVIIMENEDAPADVRDRITRHQFTKNREFGRYGFFPA